jgi:hypothetical protein
VDVLEGHNYSANGFVDCTSLHQLHYCGDAKGLARGKYFHGVARKYRTESRKLSVCLDVMFVVTLLTQTHNQVTAGPAPRSRNAVLKHGACHGVTW